MIKLIFLDWAQGGCNSDIPVSLILDRDGVLVDLSSRYATCTDEITVLPTVADTLMILAKKGLRAAIVTNQSGIGRGLVSQHDVLNLHHLILEILDPGRTVISFSLICPHSPLDNCECRKPKTEHILAHCQLFASFNTCFFVGDQLSDIACASNLGARAVHIRTGHGLRDSQLVKQHFPDSVCIDRFEEILELL